LAQEEGIAIKEHGPEKRAEGGKRRKRLARRRRLTSSRSGAGVTLQMQR